MWSLLSRSVARSFAIIFKRICRAPVSCALILSMRVQIERAGQTEKGKSRVLRYGILSEEGESITLTEIRRHARSNATFHRLLPLLNAHGDIPLSREREEKIYRKEPDGKAPCSVTTTQRSIFGTVPPASFLLPRKKGLRGIMNCFLTFMSICALRREGEEP